MSTIYNMNYSQTIPMNVIESPLLSNGAFRLYVFLVYCPHEWEITGQEIKDRLLIRDPKTIAKYFHELVDNKLVEREYIRSTDGKLTGHMKYIVK